MGKKVADSAGLSSELLSIKKLPGLKEESEISSEISPSSSEARRRGEYILDKTISTVSSIRVRLDRLVFILIVISLAGILVGIYPPENGKVIIEFFGTPMPVPHYVINVSITMILTAVFTLIGSSLIDYIRKRSLLESYANEFLPEISAEERADILVHASFYEFMYELDIFKKELRQPASLFLLFIFYSSHGVAIFQIFNCLGGKNPYAYLISAGLLVYFFALYRTFVRSTIKSKASLGNVMVNLLWKSLLVTIAILGITLFLNI